MPDTVASLLDYYQRLGFNPVPIAVEDPMVWIEHARRRLNLYERHLGIPLFLLRDRKVLEFGPNSGENALVLAEVGARLTLVEPNDQVIPRLLSLFQAFSLESAIVDLQNTGIFDFQPDGTYDLVLAEGFLFTLPRRDEAVARIAQLLGPGGLAVISFNDRYGLLLEGLKRFVLWRACRLLGHDPNGQASLETAQRLFSEDYAALGASRPFEAWWRDTLVNPFLEFDYLWSFEEILPCIEAAGCVVQSSSPQWLRSSHYRWYKKTFTTPQWHQAMLMDWRRAFSFIVTGRPPVGEAAADAAVLAATRELVSLFSLHFSVTGAAAPLDGIVWPEPLDAYLRAADPALGRFCDEAAALLAAARAEDGEALMTCYAQSMELRRAWGAPYHYLSFSRPLDFFARTGPKPCAGDLADSSLGTACSAANRS